LRKGLYLKPIFNRILFIVIIIFFYLLPINISNAYCNQILPIAVMIGNTPQEIAHQTGLANADIVYEINVEYPFTRLMAIFLNNDSTIVGPIRSSRYYFSRLAAEWSPIFAHCGGQSIKNDKIIDLDQMHYSSPYWRDKNIGGWINLFSNTDNLREKCRRLGFQTKLDLENYLINSRTLNLSRGNISKISIKYNQKYSVSYIYQPNSNTYLRYVNDLPHKDSKSLEHFSTSNIIIQYVSVEKIKGDKAGRLEVNVIGEGMAKIFYGGHYFISKWVKKSKDQQTIYYDSQGNPLKLNKGKIWIQIVPTETKVWFK